MALTPERINELKEQAVSAWRKAGFEPMLQVFVARAIEDEVRKQDTALIRQMRDALETCDNADGYNGPYQFYNDKAVEEAITAANARLEGKP